LLRSTCIMLLCLLVSGATPQGEDAIVHESALEVSQLPVLDTELLQELSQEPAEPSDTGYVSGNNNDNDTNNPSTSDPSTIAAAITKKVDTSVSPCDDFYQHSCGQWVKDTKLPGDHTSWDSFSVVAKRVKSIVKDILDGKTTLTDDQMPKDVLDKLLTFYQACNDESNLEKMGSKPLQAFVKPLLASIKDKKSFMQALAHLSSQGLDKLFGFGISVDPKHPLVHITSLSQGGLLLPDRSYYLKTQHNKMLQSQYQPFINRTLLLLKLNGVSKKMGNRLSKRVLAFEKELAKITVDRTKLRDPIKTYHKYTKDELFQLAPMMADYFEAQHRNKEYWQKSPKIYTSTPTFFQDLDKLISKTKISTLKAYLGLHLGVSLSSWLSDKVSYPAFKFFDVDLEGVKERMPRWKRCYSAADSYLPDIVGRAFAAVAFKGDAKAKAQTIIQQIEAGFNSTLNQLSWLDDTTRAKAQFKLSKLVDMIGYPNKWYQYKAQIGANHFNNVLALNKESNERDLNHLGKPVDRTKWSMSAAEVNAYYSPETNSIVFPAAILQPPFYDAHSPMAANFGGIGSVMGHELTHGYDDQGRLYGPHGTLHSWWKKKTAARFTQRVQCVAKQYSQFQLPGKPAAFVNGNLTLGEDLADNGGVQNSFKAYTRWAAKQPGGLAAQKFGELTGPQLFFYSFGQIWCNKQTEKAERMQAVTDVHAPGRFRVNGALQNTPAFAQAFGCKVGSKMNPGKGRCLVWTPDDEDNKA